jgi:hypothetical protein
MPPNVMSPSVRLSAIHAKLDYGKYFLSLERSSLLMPEHVMPTILSSQPYL